MWQQQVLNAVAAENLDQQIQEAVHEELRDYEGPRVPDLEARLWVQQLRQAYHDARELDLKVEALEQGGEFSPSMQEFFELYKQLPHMLVKTHYSLIKQAAATYHKTSKIDNEFGFQDLLSAGQEALFLAASKYYLNPKGPFKNFAWNLLRLKLKEDQQQRHPIPGKVRKQLRHLEIIREELRFRGEPASNAILMEKLQVSAMQLADLLAVEAIWGNGADFETDIALEELEEPDQSPSALSMLISKEDRVRVEAALERLPSRSKTIIQEIYFAEKSLRQLADELGVSINSMKKAHKKALSDLRLCLDV
ncbi:MAG: sigma-70 family RNA polymerase sigma factor [Oligoflexus sp.]